MKNLLLAVSVILIMLGGSGLDSKSILLPTAMCIIGMIMLFIYFLEESRK